MDMIWHYDPCFKDIPLPIKETQRILQHLRDGWVPQLAIPAAFIEIVFQLRPALAIILNFEQVFPLGSQGIRETVRKTYCHKLREARLVPVRKVSSFMPAAEPAPRLFNTQRRRPLALFGDKLSQRRILWWAGIPARWVAAHREEFKLILK